MRISARLRSVSFLLACFCFQCSEADSWVVHSQWEFRVSSPNASASENTKLDEWRSFDFPGQPAGISGEWLQQRTHLPAVGPGQSLHFLTVDQFVQVFLDGEPLYGFGDSNSPGNAISSGPTMHLVSLPIVPAGTQLEFRIYSLSENKGLNGAIRIGPSEELLLSVLRKELPALTLSLLYIVGGILFGVAVIAGKRGWDAYFFAAFMLALGLWSLTQLEIKAVLSRNALLWRWVDLCALFTLPVWIGRFFELSFERITAFIVRLFVILHALYAGIALPLIFTGTVPPEYFFRPLQISMLAFFATLTVLAFRGGRAGDRDARLFFLSLVGILLAGCLDVLVALGWRDWC